MLQCMNLRVYSTVVALFLVLVLASSTSVFAADGVILIDQNRALAGNVTPGDAPGFPVTISQPGSYRLSSNLVVPADSNGIELTVDGVTLDLNGFAIIGSGSGTGTGIIARDSGARGVIILRGTILLFQDGINLTNSTFPNLGADIEQVRALNNTRNGIVFGTDGVAIRNSALSNGGVGIQGAGIFKENTATLNQIGLKATRAGSLVQGNNVTVNFFGIAAVCPANLIENTAAPNAQPFDLTGSGVCSSINNIDRAF
jgi:hypothetical protein